VPISLSNRFMAEWVEADMGAMISSSPLNDNAKT
jgi:hypothetical protein